MCLQLPDKWPRSTTALATGQFWGCPLVGQEGRAVFSSTPFLPLPAGRGCLKCEAKGNCRTNSFPVKSCIASPPLEGLSGRLRRSLEKMTLALSGESSLEPPLHCAVSNQCPARPAQKHNSLAFVSTWFGSRETSAASRKYSQP